MIGGDPWGGVGQSGGKGSLGERKKEPKEGTVRRAEHRGV